ncbi:MAG: hypothetical protein KKB50_16760 [Planctomycetes bacterium]|nr:hypothetical protein [Planctomycetota bacterium]
MRGQGIGCRRPVFSLTADQQRDERVEVQPIHAAIVCQYRTAGNQHVSAVALRALLHSHRK